jgi:hypothetical protein
MLPLYKVEKEREDDDDYNEWRCGSTTLIAVYVNYLDKEGFIGHYLNKSIIKECDDVLV